jgi:hypothetical protein
MKPAHPFVKSTRPSDLSQGTLASGQCRSVPGIFSIVCAGLLREKGRGIWWCRKFLSLCPLAALARGIDPRVPGLETTAGVTNRAIGWTRIGKSLSRDAVLRRRPEPRPDQIASRSSFLWLGTGFCWGPGSRQRRSSVWLDCPDAPVHPALGEGGQDLTQEKLFFVSTKNRSKLPQTPSRQRRIGGNQGFLTD